jgi:glucosamine--fructose-6-phosphate aminotransferase (isomerizing)
MCGIIAVLIRRSRRRPPATDDLRRLLRQGIDALPAQDRLELTRSTDLRLALGTAADRLRDLDTALQGAPGVLALRADGGALANEIESATAALQQRLDVLERNLDSNGAALGATRLEELNAALIRLKDAAWSVRQDRLRTYRAVVDLAGPEAGDGALHAYLALQVSLSALDRLEVRGRDSAGVHVYVHDHRLDLTRAPWCDELAARSRDPLFTNNSVRVTPEGHLSFVYKAAAEIGELGDNTRALRAAMRADHLLRAALAADSRAHGARPHPLGERRHHQPAQRAPAQLKRSGSPRVR